MERASPRMSDLILERYIARHIDASPEKVIRFSWHGGEPTVLGLDYFRKVAALQRKYLPPGRRIMNGIQTNGTLLDEEWCRFLAAEGFSVGSALTVRKKCTTDPRGQGPDAYTRARDARVQTLEAA